MQICKKESKSQNKVFQFVLTALLTAVIAIMSQIAIPLPVGIPITLQTFAVAFCGYLLGIKFGLCGIGIYIVLGAVGVPVFANFKGGIGALVGLTGGFIYGFIFLVVGCGISVLAAQHLTKPVFKYTVCFILGIVGLLACHLCGVLHYVVLTGNAFVASALTMSVPFLLKDIMSVVVAFFVAKAVRKLLRNIFE